MGLFSLYLKDSLSPQRGNVFNELTVNGVDISDDDNFDMEFDDDDDDDLAEGEDAPSDQAQDAVENPDAPEEDNAPAVDDTSDEDPDADNFTIQDDETEMTQTTNDNEDEEDNFTLEEDQDQPQEDQQSTDGNTETPTTDEAPADNGGDDQSEQSEDQDQQQEEDPNADNFTMTDDQASGGGDEEGEAPPEGDESQQQQGNTNNQSEELPEDPTDNVSDDDLRSSEEQMYDSLTDDQKRARTLALKIDFKNLYESILSSLEGINGIPKSLDNIDTINRVLAYTTRSKEILIDYIQNNFDKSPYLENYSVYIKFLAVLRTVSNVINELNIISGKAKL